MVGRGAGTEVEELAGPPVEGSGQDLERLPGPAVDLDPIRRLPSRAGYDG